MGLFKSKNFIKIKKDDLEYVQNLVKSVINDKARKRAFVSLLGLSAVAKYLFKEKIDADTERSFYRINKFLNDYEVADIYVNDIRIETRVVIGDEFPQMWVPKNHFSDGFLADIYVGVRINRDFKEAEIVGFISSKNILTYKASEKYYFVDAESLTPVAELKKLLETVGPFSDALPSSYHKRAQELFLSFLDNEILHEDRSFLLKHLAKCNLCRQEFMEFSEFHKKGMLIKDIAADIKDYTLDLFAGDFPAQDEEVVISLKDEEANAEAETEENQEENSQQKNNGNTVVAPIPIPIPLVGGVPPVVVPTIPTPAGIIPPVSGSINIPEPSENILHETQENLEDLLKKIEEHSEQNDEPQVDYDESYDENNMTPEQQKEAMDVLELSEDVEKEIAQAAEAEFSDFSEDEFEQVPAEPIDLEALVSEENAEPIDLEALAENGIEPEDTLENLGDENILEKEESEPLDLEALENPEGAEDEILSEEMPLSDSSENSLDFESLEEPEQIAQASEIEQPNDEENIVGEEPLIDLDDIPTTETLENHAVGENAEESLSEALVDFSDLPTTEASENHTLEEGAEESSSEDVPLVDFSDLPTTEAPENQVVGEDTEESLSEDVPLIDFSDLPTTETPENHTFGENAEESLSQEAPLIDFDDLPTTEMSENHTFEEGDQSALLEEEPLIDFDDISSGEVSQDVPVAQEENALSGIDALEQSEPEENLLEEEPELDLSDISQGTIGEESTLSDSTEEIANNLDKEPETVENTEDAEASTMSELDELVETTSDSGNAADDFNLDTLTSPSENGEISEEDMDLEELSKHINDLDLSDESVKDAIDPNVLKILFEDEQNKPIDAGVDKQETSTSSAEATTLDKLKDKKVLIAGISVAALGILTGVMCFTMNNNQNAANVQQQMNNSQMANSQAINNSMRPPQGGQMPQQAGQPYQQGQMPPQAGQQNPQQAGQVPNGMPPAPQPVNGVQKAPSKDINEAVSKAFGSRSNGDIIRVQKISWDVPASLANDPSFYKYLQLAGRSIKLSLSQDLVTADDYAFNDNIRAAVNVDFTSGKSDATISVGSGSSKLDNIILQSIKETLTYTKLPKITSNKRSAKITLIINL